MLSPDIWTFDPPNTLITHRHESLKRPKTEHQVKQIIGSHNFNSLISIVVPDTTVVPVSIATTLDDSDYYVIEQVSLSEFVDRRFIEAFVKRGQFYGLSVDTRIDIDDCAAVTPRAGAPTLCLSLNKDVFQSLGLEGTVSAFTQKSRDRYNIRLDLLNPDLAPNTKFYERVRNGLTNEVLPRMSMRVAWQPPDDSDVCPSSVAKYFSDRGYKVRLVQTDVRQHQEYSLELPNLGRDDPDTEPSSDGFYATPSDLLEYIGMISLGCSREPSDYLNSYRCHGRSTPVGNATVFQWRGMFTCTTIERLFDSLRHYISDKPHLPWVSMFCSGFPHALVSFGHKEHSIGTNSGDNSYSVVLTPADDCLLTTVLGSNKMAK